GEGGVFGCELVLACPAYYPHQPLGWFLPTHRFDAFAFGWPPAFRFCDLAELCGYEFHQFGPGGSELVFGHLRGTSAAVVVDDGEVGRVRVPGDCFAGVEFPAAGDEDEFAHLGADPYRLRGSHPSLLSG